MHKLKFSIYIVVIRNLSTQYFYSTKVDEGVVIDVGDGVVTIHVTTSAVLCTWIK